MNEPLDEEYLEWLYRQVGNPDLKNPKRTFWSLFRQLYLKEFLWRVANDDNRVADGQELKFLFVEETGAADSEDPWVTEPGCSMLEMLIALSGRLAFDAGGESADWFWHLLDNIDLRGCNDASRYDERLVDEHLDDIIWRRYNSDGRGGLFPLRNPQEDQREVELWYQMNSYILEQL